MQRLFGLIGYPLGHSFSKTYFKAKFEREGIEAEYGNFPLPDIAAFPGVIAQHSGLCGLNVTIPYKEAIIPFLDRLDPAAREVGAVNTIRFDRKAGEAGQMLTGYNTDVQGFSKALEPLLHARHRRALVLGTGGASKAVVHVLNSLGIEGVLVSRKPGDKIKSYSHLRENDMQDFLLIVNTTPLGMHPKTDDCPPIPYEGLGADHLLFDLVYNPEETLFMQKGIARGAQVSNGYSMLVEQAEAAWKIWNNDLP